MSLPDTPTDRPVLLRVVRGRPTAEELAAIVAVVAAAGSVAGSVDHPRGLSRWADHRRLLRGPLEHGRGAWRASALPR